MTMDYEDRVKEYLDRGDLFYVPVGYEKLAEVLVEALRQAANGKGKERHSNNEPFEQQKICRIGRSVGIGFPLGQAIKKAEESLRLSPEAGIRELLGAINYLAASAILMGELNVTDDK